MIVRNFSRTVDKAAFNSALDRISIVFRPIINDLRASFQFLWQFDSIIMQNVSHRLRFFCAPAWLSYDLIEDHLSINKCAMLYTIQQARYLQL